MPKSRPLEERFWEKVEKQTERGTFWDGTPCSPCWLWTGCVQDGYGRFNPGKGLRVFRAHTYAYIQAKGPIPEGLELDHLCRNRNCCNPDHLEAVTRQVNFIRGSNPTAQRTRANVCKNGHEMTPENTYARKGGGGREGRRCRQCTLERTGEYQKKHRERYNQYSAKWYASDPEHAREVQMKYREAHREELATRSREWRLNNKTNE